MLGLWENQKESFKLTDQIFEVESAKIEVNMQEETKIGAVVRENGASLLSIKLLRADPKEVVDSATVETVIADALKSVFCDEAEVMTWDDRTIDALEWVRNL